MSDHPFGGQRFMRIPMVTVETSVCIDAPVDEVWALLARLGDVRLWSEAILDATCDGPITEGVGAQRTCRLRGGITISERWLQWDEGHSFTYEGSSIPGVVNARNHWSVVPVGTQTQLRSRAEVQLKGGHLARLLEPLVSRQIQRVGTRTLAALKYLVEHGEPPPVRHRRLAAVPAIC